MQNEFKTFWTAFKAKPFNWLAFAAFFTLTAYIIDLSYGLGWLMAGVAAMALFAVASIIAKGIGYLWAAYQAHRVKTEPLRAAAFQRKLNAANAEVELEEHLAKSYIPLFKGMSVAVTIAFFLVTLASVLGTGNGYLEVLVNPNWVTLTLAVLLTCGLGMFQFTYWKMYLTAVLQQGWKGFFKYFAFLPLFLALVLPASTFFMVVGLAGDYLKKEYYIQQVAETVKPAITAVIAQRVNDGQLAPVFSTEAAQWRTIADAERKTGLITGSAGDGQVTFAAEDNALKLEGVSTAIIESAARRATLITELEAKLMALETAARNYVGDEVSILTQIQDINTLLSQLQAETPLLALKSAAQAVGQLALTAPSSNTAFAQRQAVAIASLQAKASASRVRLNTAIAEIEGYTVPEVRNIASPNTVELVLPFWRKIQMYLVAAVAIDVCALILIFAVAVLRINRKSVGLDIEPQPQQPEPNIPASPANVVTPAVVESPVQTAAPVLSEKLKAHIVALAEKDFADGAVPSASLLEMKNIDPSFPKGTPSAEALAIYSATQAQLAMNGVRNAPTENTSPVVA